MKHDYRKIWEDYHNNKIPIDENGRSYEIHHIDGNHNNNSIDNLMCVSIDEHYDIHYNQKDYAACHLIAKRKALSPKELSNIVSALNKLRVGDKNPFYGKTHTEETRIIISKRVSGEKHPFYGKKRPEFAEKISKILKGRKKSLEHCKALSVSKKGKVSKLYSYIIFRNGVEETIINLKAFCRDNNLPYHKIRAGVEVQGFRLKL